MQPGFSTINAIFLQCYNYADLLFVCPKVTPGQSVICLYISPDIADTGALGAAAALKSIGLSGLLGNTAGLNQGIITITSVSKPILFCGVGVAFIIKHVHSTKLMYLTYFNIRITVFLVLLFHRKCFII